MVTTKSVLPETVNLKTHIYNFAYGEIMKLIIEITVKSTVFVFHYIGLPNDSLMACFQS